MSKQKEWFITGCPICVFSSHTNRPRRYCPNDGMPLIRLPGLTASWQRLEAARARLDPDPVLRALATGIRGVIAAAAQ